MYTVRYKSIYRNGGCFFYAQNKVVTEMPDVVKNPVSDVFERWRTTIEPVVGKGNVSTDESQTVASNKSQHHVAILRGMSVRQRHLSNQNPMRLVQKLLQKHMKLTMPVTRLWLAWGFVGYTGP